MSRRGSTLTFVLAAALLLYGATSRADAVGPPPEDCPNGSYGTAMHGGPFCAPDICRDNSDCIDDQTCQERRICVSQFESISAYGRNYYDQFAGSCAGGATCSEGECQRLQVCATGIEEDYDAGPLGDADSDAGPLGDADDDRGFVVRTYGCGCQQVQSQQATGALLFAVLPGLALIGMRRWRKRR